MSLEDQSSPTHPSVRPDEASNENANAPTGSETAASDTPQESAPPASSEQTDDTQSPPVGSVESGVKGQESLEPEVEAVTPEAGSEPTADTTSETNAVQSDVSESSEQAPAAESPAAESAAPKVKLNPTVDSDKAKAVPNVSAGGPPPAASDETSAQETSTQQDKPASAETAPDRKPVEIPNVDDLDADLESQLQAALSGSDASGGEGSDAPASEEDLEPGTQLTGKVESVEEENIIINLGIRFSGILNKRNVQEGKVPEVGAEIDVVVMSVDAEEGIVHLGMLDSVHKSGGDWSTLAVGQVVECMVEKTNKGGLSITVGQIRGFMPAGQVDLYFIGDLEPFVGQKLTGRIIDLNPKKRNLVVSRKQLLMEEREAQAAKIWETIAVGDNKTGTVKTIKDYGAFVDIGGLDGLLHVREMSWTRINHPSDVMKEGDQIEVKVLTADPEKKKISLGMKQLLTNPWENAELQYPKGTVITGTVKKTTDFGAFVEIEPGLEGLIHISELDHRRVGHVGEVLKEGQETQAQVLEVNKNKKRISLSLKAMMAKPEMSPEEKAKRAADAEERERFRIEAEKRRATLKGGKSTSSGGGLFGNPSDFNK